MYERTIFFNALEEVDPEQRRAYLDFASTGNPALRERIEALLRSHQLVDTFLEVPAIEQFVANDQRLVSPASSTQPGSLGRLDYHEILRRLSATIGSDLMVHAWSLLLVGSMGIGGALILESTHEGSICGRLGSSIRLRTRV
jgi:hypothetical protein